MHYDVHVSIIFLFMVGIGGSMTEMIVMYTTKGLWKYRNPNVGLMPMWLPILWAIVGAGVLTLNDFAHA